MESEESRSCYTGGMALTNAYVLRGDEGTVLIDAPEGVVAWLERVGLKVDLLLLTHHHFDHVMEAGLVQERFGCPVWAHSRREPELTLENLMRSMGMDLQVPEYSVDELLAGRDEVDVLGMRCRLFYVPGHARDNLCFYFVGAGAVYVGDALFKDGVGRYDFPGGSLPLLVSGIRKHLLSLPPETVVYPGHGEATTVGRERVSNPFVVEKG